MQRVGLFHLLELRQASQHVSNCVQIGCIGVLVGEVWVLLEELLEIAHKFVNRILHVPMSIVHPDFVLVCKFHVLLFRLRGSFVDNCTVCDFVAVFDRKKIVRHRLVRKLVYERCH